VRGRNAVVIFEPFLTAGGKLESCQVFVKVVPAADRAARDPNLIRFDRFANVVRADHRVVDHDRQPRADMIARVGFEFVRVRESHFCALIE